MNAESNTSTKGGSLPPLSSACCAVCGRGPERIEPEVLHALVGYEAGAVPLPDGSLEVHAGGSVYRMSLEAWERYKALCASSVATALAMAAV